MSIERSRVRRRLLEFSIVVGTLAALAVVGEIGLRIASQFAEPLARRPLPEAWRELPEIEGTLGLIGRNVRGVRSGVLFETNRAGLRGPFRPKRKPRGVYRVLLIGDSFAMGEGVLYPDTYGARLERRLNAERSDRKYELINVAVSGLATEGVVNRLENVGMHYQPDLIVYGYTVNDIEGPDYRKSADGRYTYPYYYRESTLHLTRFFGPRARMLLEMLVSPRGSQSFELEDNYLRNEAAMAQLHDGLDRIRRLASRSDACTVVLVHTQLWALNALHPFRRVYAAVSEAAEQRGFLAIETHPHFVRLLPRASQDYWIHYNDSHPNAEGHAVLSEALWEGLEDLPAGCWD